MPFQFGRGLDLNAPDRHDCLDATFKIVRRPCSCNYHPIWGEGFGVRAM